MQAPPRLHVSHPLRAGEAVPAAAGQARYLGAVMRRAPGDPVILFNGRDGEWEARIVRLGRDGAELRPERRLRAQEREPDLWLLFAPLRRDATDLVARAATELGVSALLPVLTARTQAQRVNTERLAAIAAEAAEQSERLSVPEVRAPAPLAAVLDAWDPRRTLAVAAERTPPDAEPPPGPPAPLALLTGPEGGFTEGELDGLRRRPFVVTLTLGPRILRAETAAIAGLALLQARAWHAASPPSRDPRT